MKLARLLLRHRAVILVVTALLWLASAVIASRLEFNFSFWTLFVSHDPEVLKQIRLTKTWGEDSAVIFVGLRSKSGHVATAANLELVDEIERRVAQVDGIRSVTSLLSATTVRGEGDDVFVGPLVDSVPAGADAAAALEHEALADPLMAGTLLSRNGRTTVVAARIVDGLHDAKDRNPVVDRVEAIAREVTRGSDLTPLLAGIPIAQRVYSEKMARDMLLFVAISCVLLAVILAIMFRSVAGVVLPLAVIAAATTWTMSLLVLTGEQVNMLNVALPTLMLVIGIADGVHLLAHFLRRRSLGDDVETAAKTTFVRLGWACMLTSATTAVGFASLASARIGTVRNFGIYAGVGIMLAYVANMVLMPIGLSLLPPAPRVVRNDDRTSLVRLLEWLGTWTVAHPWRTLTVSLSVIAAIAVGGRLIKVETRMFEEISDDDPVVVANRTLEEDLPGVSTYALDVTTEPGGAVDPEVLAGLDHLAKMAEADPTVDRAVGIATIIETLNRATHGGDPAAERIPDDPRLISQLLLLAEGDLTERLVNDDRSRTQVWMRGPESVSTAWESLRARLEAEAATVLPDTKVVVTGSTCMAMRALGSIIDDIMKSLAGATLIIFLMMALLFRSLRVGLLSMVPNIIPLAVTVGVMGYAGIALRTSTVIIFSVSLGLAVDDTIHFLVRFRRERSGGAGVPAAVLATMRTAGRPIVYTSLLLVGGFWILILSSFKATRDVGLLGGVTLLAALVADLIVLPALLAAFPGRTAGRAVESLAPPTELSGTGA